MIRGRLHEAVKNDQAFTPKDRSTANTLYNDAAIADAAGIDTQGYDDVVVVINCGVIGATTLTFDVGFADIDDAEDSSFAILSGTTQAVVNADDGKEFTIGIRAKDNGRYLFVKCVQADAVSAVYGVSVQLGQADKEPVTQSQTVVAP